MTTVYVDGKKVTKGDVKNIEIQNENARRIFAEHLKKKDCA